MSTALHPMLPDPIPALASVERLREGGRERTGFVGLDRNERLSPLPETVLAELRAAIDSDLFTRYPSTESSTTSSPPAGGAAGARAAHGRLGRGRARAAPCLRAARRPHGHARPVVRDVSGLRPDVRCRTVEIPFADDLSLDRDALLEAVRSGPRAVFLANPNQPTGTVLTPTASRS